MPQPQVYRGQDQGWGWGRQRGAVAKGTVTAGDCCTPRKHPPLTHPTAHIHPPTCHAHAAAPAPPPRPLPRSHPPHPHTLSHPTPHITHIPPTPPTRAASRFKELVLTPLAAGAASDRAARAAADVAADAVSPTPLPPGLEPSVTHFDAAAGLRRRPNGAVSSWQVGAAGGPLGMALRMALGGRAEEGCGDG